jgi:hypothetical protein
MRMAAVRFGLVTLAALAAAACGGLLGIEDRSLDPEGQGDASPVEAQQQDASGSDGSGCGDPCTMATGLNHPFEIAVDENNVYWTEFGGDVNTENGAVKSCPVTGCAGVPLAYMVFQASPRGIVVDGQNVYWGIATGQTSNGAIYSCPVAGCNGNPMKLADANTPFRLALDDTYVYWADNSDDTVHRALKAGGGDTLLSDGGSGPVSIGSGQGCAVDDASVYVTDNYFELFRLPLGGGDLALMYGASLMYYGPAPVAVHSSGVYLGVPGNILRFDKGATSAPGTAITSMVVGASALQMDVPNAMLYWSDYGSSVTSDGTIGKVPVDGGPATILQKGLATPESVAVNSTYVFWISNGRLVDSSGSGETVAATGALYRTHK